MSKAAPGEALRFYQEVVLVYEGDECLIWPYSRSAKGYGRVRPSPAEGPRLVHQMICEEVNGPRPTPAHHAAHGCGKGFDGCVTKRHMEWKTPAENQADRIAHGTSNRGANAWQARLTEAAVREIRAGGKPRELAERFGVRPSTIHQVRRRATWKDVE